MLDRSQGPPVLSGRKVRTYFSQFRKGAHEPKEGITDYSIRCEICKN